MRNIYTVALLLLCLQSKAQWGKYIDPKKNHDTSGRNEPISNWIRIGNPKPRDSGGSIQVTNYFKIDPASYHHYLDIAYNSRWIMRVEKDTIYVKAGEKTFKIKFSDTLFYYNGDSHSVITKDTTYFLPNKK